MHKNLISKMIQILFLLLLILAIFLLAKKPTTAELKEDAKLAATLLENQPTGSSSPTAQQTQEIDPQTDVSVPDIGVIQKVHSAPEYIGFQNEKKPSVDTVGSSLDELGENLRSKLSENEKKDNNSRKNTIKGFNFRNKKTNFAKENAYYVENAENISRDTIIAKPSLSLFTIDQNIVTSNETFVKLPKDISNEHGNTKKAPLRSKGFNFRNPGNLTQRKIAKATELDSNSHSSSSKSSPEKQQDDKGNCVGVSTNALESCNEKAVKKVRGFNFRNNQKPKLL